MFNIQRTHTFAGSLALEKVESVQDFRKRNMMMMIVMMMIVMMIHSCFISERLVHAKTRSQVGTYRHFISAHALVPSVHISSGRTVHSIIIRINEIQEGIHTLDAIRYNTTGLPLRFRQSAVDDES